VTLLSSTSQPSLSPIFTTHTDLALPSDSLITYLPDSNKIPQDTPRGSGIPKHATRGNISHPVVHIQSPTLNTTYIQAGCSLTKARRRREKGKGRAGPLGVELEWIGLQLKRLGRREMGFEIGIVDRRGREGVVRCSSFQVGPSSAPIADWSRSRLLSTHIALHHSFTCHCPYLGPIPRF